MRFFKSRTTRLGSSAPMTGSLTVKTPARTALPSLCKRHNPVPKDILRSIHCQDVGHGVIIYDYQDPNMKGVATVFYLIGCRERIPRSCARAVITNPSTAITKYPGLLPGYSHLFFARDSKFKSCPLDFEECSRECTCCDGAGPIA